MQNIINVPCPICEADITLEIEREDDSGLAPGDSRRLNPYLRNAPSAFRVVGTLPNSCEHMTPEQMAEHGWITPALAYTQAERAELDTAIDSAINQFMREARGL